MNSIKTSLSQLSETFTVRLDIIQVSFNINDDKIIFTCVFAIAAICIFIISCLNSYYRVNKNISLFKKQE